MGKGLICALVGLTGPAALIYASVPAKADPAVYVHGDNWLKDSVGNVPNGVPVCSPTAGNTCDGEQPDVVPVTLGWQCVELAQRLYKYKGWDTKIIQDNKGIFPDVPGAKDIYTQAQKLGFKAIPNGQVSEVKPGDMIIHNQTDPNIAPDPTTHVVPGHVAIVDNIVSTPNTGSTIIAMEQNWSHTGISYYHWDGHTISRTSPQSSASSAIDGLVHSPLNVGDRMAVTQADFNELCVRGGADGARLIAPNAYSWACYKGSQIPSPPAINMLSYCQSSYPNLTYVDFLSDFNDPFSWKCFGPAVNEGALNQNALRAYCKKNGFSDVSQPGKTADDWSCIASNGSSEPIYATPTPTDDNALSMGEACREQYNLPMVRARVENYYDAGAVKCWGSNNKPLVPPAPSTVTAQLDSGGAGIRVAWTVGWINNSVQAAGFEISYAQTKADFAVAPNHLFASSVCTRQTSPPPVSNCFISSDWGLNTDSNYILRRGQQMCFKVSTYNTTGSSPYTPNAADPVCVTVP